jgi:hypothetical protein
VGAVVRASRGEFSRYEEFRVSSQGLRVLFFFLFIVFY